MKEREGVPQFTIILPVFGMLLHPYLLAIVETMLFLFAITNRNWKGPVISADYLSSQMVLVTPSEKDLAIFAAFWTRVSIVHRIHV
jgi:hypothetical protein